jgi:hypothetical protein
MQGKDSMGVLNVPIIDQFVTIARTGAPDPFADSDCGEACAAMELYYWNLPVPSLSDIRNSIPGHRTYGQTDGPNLAEFMQGRGLGSHVEYTSVGRVEFRVKLAIDNGNPPILLGTFVAPDFLHWIVPTGFDNAQMMFNDPYHGRKRAEPWQWVVAQYRGEVVLVYPR